MENNFIIFSIGDGYCWGLSEIFVFKVFFDGLGGVEEESVFTAEEECEGAEGGGGGTDCNLDCSEDGHNNFLVPVEVVIILDVYFLEGGWMVSEEDGGEGATELEEFVVCFGFILVEG